MITKRWTTLLVLGAALLGVAPHAYGQKSTEIYIPIGQSPGLSHKYTVIGHIDSVDERNGAVTVTTPSRTWTANVSVDTMIWLDRTRIRMTNLYGSMADCKPGRTVEMLYEGKDRQERGSIEWVKVRIDTPPPRPRSERIVPDAPFLALGPLFSMYSLDWTVGVGSALGTTLPIGGMVRTADPPSPSTAGP